MATPSSDDAEEQPSRPRTEAWDWPTRILAVKNIAEVLAICAAGIYFGYQVLDGWRSTNLDVAVRTERVAVASTADDRLAILVDIVKGPIASVRFGAAQARVSCPGGPTASDTVVDVVGGRRVQYGQGAIQWGRYADRRYNIAEGERLQLAGLATVPHGASCFIEVVVLAPDYFPPKPDNATQWQATTISLPLAAETNERRTTR